MDRRLAFVAAVGLIAMGAWSVGHAQGRLGTFQVTVETSRGPVRVMCDRGCDWTADEGSLVCDSERCRWIFTEHGRVIVGQPR